MDGKCADAGLSRKQRVFARLEDQPGLLVFPLSSHAVLPAGDAAMSQVPTYVDSKEKFDTLDLLGKFPNAIPPGDWNIPMYVRGAGFSESPQGLDLFEATMGKKGAQFSAELAGDISDTAVSITVASVAGDVSPVGVIKIEDESIRYGSYDKATFTFGSCIRGYDGTAAAEHSDEAEVSMLSRVFLLDTCSPSLSIWIESDTLIQFMSGCVVDELSVPVQNEDGVLLSFKGKGMRMGWVGRSTVKTAAASGNTQIIVNDPKRFSIGGRIYDKTANDFGAAGYEIANINFTTGELTLADGITSSWAVGDDIAGYLPPPDITGDVVESRDTSLAIGGVLGKIKNSTLTISMPHDFPQEVGTKYPEEYVGNTRSITTSLDCILRRSSVEKFHDGYNGVETSLLITMGRVPGKKLSFYMPRVKPEVPSVQFDGPTLGLKIAATALGVMEPGQVGENSISIVFE
jgi:hypothetical protein